MKKIMLGFCIIVFGVSVAMADEIATRLGYNCVERLKLNGVSSDRALPECLVKLETMVAQQGSQATFKEYEYIWSPSEPMQSVVSKLVAKIAQEKGYKGDDETTIQKLSDEITRLNKNNDYRTLACLYINKPNTKCLK